MTTTQTNSSALSSIQLGVNRRVGLLSILGSAIALAGCGGGGSGAGATSRATRSIAGSRIAMSARWSFCW